MKIVVIGSGSWGSALSQVLIDQKLNVVLYGNNVEEITEINTYHTNKLYFKDITLPENLHATTDINTVEDADMIVLSVPTLAIEGVCQEIDAMIKKQVIIVNTSKGFHPETFERMSDVIRKNIASKHLSSVVSLIGPSHAEEVVQRMLTSICAVSRSVEDARVVQKQFSNEYLRVYTGNDEIGAEIGVALKNAIALASGILSGLGYGDNTRAALMTRGLAEMTRFGEALGGRKETFTGLSGMGDLIVTCTSQHSRNFQAGFAIGENNDASTFLKQNTKTVEGIRTVKAVHEIAQQKKIKMPIIEEIYKVLFENAKPSQSAKNLMLRDLKDEFN